MFSISAEPTKIGSILKKVFKNQTCYRDFAIFVAYLMILRFRSHKNKRKQENYNCTVKLDNKELFGRSIIVH